MKLYTLGTSHAAAEKGRSCSGSLLSVLGSYYLFDCGADIEAKLVNMDIDPADIRAMFISHMHADHVGSLVGMTKRVAHQYNKKGTTTQVFLPEAEAIPPYLAWLDAMHFDVSNINRFNMQPTNPGIIYCDEAIRVTAISTKHMMNGKYPSFAYMVEGEGKRFLYTGDLSSDFSDYPEIVYEKDFDLILSELVHFNVDKNLQSIIKSRTKKMVFTHLGPKNIPVIEQAASEFPFFVSVASDGECFEF